MWRPTDLEAYSALVATRLVHKTFNEGELDLLRQSLVFDKRKDGFHGLCLLQDVPSLGLRRGLRLLEEGPVDDLHALHLIKAPTHLVFFDAAAERAMNFVGPLFTIVGFSMASLRLDVMHVFDLGIAQWAIGTVFMNILLNNAFRSTMEHADARLMQNLIRLRKRIRAFYSKECTRETSRIDRLTMKMLGTRALPRLKAKAAETRHLLPLAVKLVSEYKGQLGEHGFFIKGAVENLAAVYKVMRESPRKMPPAKIAALERHMGIFLAFWKASTGHCYYKHHMGWHLVERAKVDGNPKCYHTYPDENENRLMGKVAKSVHGGRRFYEAVLEKVLADSL